MNKDAKFALTVWIIITIIPMLALAVMQPLPGTEIYTTVNIESVRLGYVTMTLQSYITPFFICMVGAFISWFFMRSTDEKSKNRRNA